MKKGDKEKILEQVGKLKKAYTYKQIRDLESDTIKIIKESTSKKGKS